MPYANIEDRKACNKRYYQRNRERMNALVAKWKAEHPEADALHDLRYNQKNAEKIKAYRQAYRTSEHGKKVRAASGKRHYENMTPMLRKQRMLNCARAHALKKNLPFDLCIEDLHWPEVCPVFGIKLNYGCPKNGRYSYDSPSLDRHIPALGYVKGNVVVMSWRANAIKRDATFGEMAMLFAYLCKKGSH